MFVRLTDELMLLNRTEYVSKHLAMVHSPENITQCSE
jgi:hypothetical protein